MKHKKTTVLKVGTLFIGLILILPIINSTGSNTEQEQIESQSTENEISSSPPGWSEDVRLTYAPSNSEDPDMIIDDNWIFIVWKDYRSGSFEVYFKKSEDSGLTWSEDVKISEVTPSPFCEPKIAVSSNQIHVVWEGIDITREVHYRNSTDGGETWNPEVRLTEDDGYQSYLPVICVLGDNLHIIWTDKRNDPDGDVYYQNSTNGGVSWNPEQRLTNSPDAETGADIAVDNSNIHITWVRWVPNEIFYMNSSDGGITWSSKQQLSPVDGIDTWPHSMAVWQDNVHIVYGDGIDGSYEVYYLNSTDGGATWNPSIRISNLPNYSSSSDIFIDKENVYIVWQDNRDNASGMEIYYAYSNDSGGNWSNNIRLTFNYTGAGPTISANDSVIHVVWYDLRDGNAEIYYKRSPDFPDTIPPSHTNETPPPDSYKDAPGTNVSVHVTDPSGVNESTIQLYVNGSLVSHTTSPITDGFNVSYISPGFEPGVVECRIVADDNCSNTLDYYWNFTVLALYEIQLHEGWNLISVPHMQVDTSMNEVLRDIDGKWDYILWYDASDPVDKWKTNATFKPQQLNDLFYLNRSMAFWINITEADVNLTVRGHISTYTEIQLYAGWNLVGYPTQTTETVANALWGTGADRVEVCNTSQPYNLAEVGATYVMKPGEGYWVHVPANTVWIIDW